MTLAELKHAAKHYTAATLDLDAARRRLHGAIRTAAEAGASKAEIARVAGLSRQHVYEVLNQRGEQR